MTMGRYPNISDHGLIGDLQTAALVTTDGVLDWFCCPRFDSPSVFASLLDAERGGFYRIAPDRDDYVSRQLYLPDTAILVTRFMTPDGVGEVHDFMPVIEGAATDRHRVVRNIRVVRGVMRFVIEVQPRFDYGRKPHKLDVSDHGVVFTSDGMELTLHGIVPEGFSLAESGITWERAGDGLRWTRTLREGEIGGVVLESMGGTPRQVTPEEAQQLQDDTARFWRSWLHRSTYTGRWREMVGRSAITLKLMTYKPTGAIVAAPTAALPEQAGGERNWDYRYTALDRAIRMATARGRPADIARWTSTRDAVYTQIMDRGWNPKVGAFTQHYDTEVLDSSLLLMPLQGFIAPRDPMWLSTLNAMDRELVSDSLVYRYNPSASPDGLKGDEGTFSLCTFWYVDALARAGRLEEARLVFEKMFTYANHLGLFSEEIDATGGQLGNFPQAFSHLSLISAAINLDRQLDGR
jgi:GH15 family glucan-1,4-alpha-glucosidase